MTKRFLLLAILLATFSISVTGAVIPAPGTLMKGDSVTLSGSGLEMRYRLKSETMKAFTNKSLDLDWDASLGNASASSKEKPYYNFKRDVSIIPLPIFGAGLIAKSQKKNFREARQKFEPNFEHHLDDYLQLSPMAASLVLKVFGVKGRSDWLRYGTSSAFSFATMALFVNGVKYTAKEMRPDGSTANSFPSGHTATAFTAATILHKEYGLTRSPWYSVAGYAAATTTGVMRSLNNRHWISDIMCGAAIGILSADLGYFFGDLIFKDRHYHLKELEGLGDFYEHPSFFSIQMGATFLPNIALPQLKEWDVVMEGKRSATSSGVYPTDDERLRIGTATSVAAEGAYFFNPYVGVGGRLKVLTAPVRANGLHCYDDQGNPVAPGGNPYQDITDQINMFSVDAGLYFQYPVSARLALGAKATVGGIFTSDVNLDSSVEGVGEDGQETVYLGDAISMESVRRTKIGTGLSLTYAQKDNIAWKLNVDYDFARIPFGVSYVNNFNDFSSLRNAKYYTTTIKKNFHMLTVGASMVVRF